MANDLAVALRGIKLELPSWAVDLAFVALIAIVFVGRSPFQPPPPISLTGITASGGAGDAVRQTIYLAVLAVLLLGALQRRGLAALSAVPMALGLLVIWCGASALWAAAPGVAFRRAALEAVLVLSIMLGVDTLGPERSLFYLRWSLAIILVINWISIPFVPNAIHRPGELDPGLVGDWRGLFGHKNTAGAVSALTAILFLFPAIENRSWRDGLIAALAIGFLLMTRSKSSLGLLPVALVAGAVYRFAWGRALDRAIVCIGACLVAAGMLALLYLYADPILRVLEDPAEFTGRAAIWQAELQFIRDHPFLGAGFGTFADTGGLSLLQNYVGGNWVTAVAQGHNGYLEMLVTVGTVGFVLAILGFLVVPMAEFWPIEPRQFALRAMLFSVFVFFALHNFMESDFFEDDGQTGVAILLVIAMLGSLARNLRLEAQEPCLPSSPL